MSASPHMPVKNASVAPRPPQSRAPVGRFRVLFLKTINDHLGHPHACVQAVIDVQRARGSERAIEAAKLRFQRQKKITDWTSHADAVECDELAPCDRSPPKSALHF